MRETRADIMARIHELSCTHKHQRADECAICMAEFEKIIKELTASETHALSDDANREMGLPEGEDWGAK